MDNCQCNTEIARDGSGQSARYLKTLDPSYAPIDDRSIEDLLVFAKRYAAQIRFYDLPESKIDDPTAPSKVSWREFFRRDMAVIAASISIIDLDKIKEDYDEIRAQVDLHPATEIFGALFNPILGIAARIDRWYSVAIPENPLRKDLDLGINSLLREQMKKMIAYEEGFKYVDPKRALHLDFTVIENDALWGVNDKIDPDYSIYEGVDPEDKIKSGALFIDDIFHAFFGFMTDLVEKSDSYFQFALEQYPGHQPHMALFITFLQIFRLAQDQMNGLTEKMLDFYYRDVLHLAEKPSMPDRVHIVFELAKDVAEYDMEQGTALKAGKDAGGKEQIYITENDIVINQAKVKELKTIYIEKLPLNADENNKTIHTIYARPIANSLDGFGAKFTDPNPKWHTLGQGSANADSSNNPCTIITQNNDLANRIDIAQTGFAVASPQLLLQGGKRLIRVQINGSQVLLQSALKSAQNNTSFFEIWLTGEKGWLKIDNVMTDVEKAGMQKYLPTGLFNPDDTQVASSYYINQEEETLNIYLPVAEMPVIAYNNKLHPGYNFETVFPVMMIMLNSAIDLSASDYEQLRITGLSLSTKVGSITPASNAPSFTYNADGLKTLILQNDLGVVPSNKPFDPFTAYPNKGKSFYVGSNEVFNKPLGKLAVNIKRTQDRGFQFGFINEAAPVPLPPLDYSISVLHDRSWDDLTTPAGVDFYQEDTGKNILFHKKGINPNGAPTVEALTILRKPIVYNTQWQSNTEKGFLRITNLIPVSGDDFFQASRNQAPVFEIKEISLSYESDLTALEAGIDQFFHIYPFGPVETYFGQQQNQDGSTVPGYGSNLPKPKSAASALAAQQQSLLVNARNHLLPQFTFLSPYSQYANETAANNPPVTLSNDQSFSISNQTQPDAGVVVNKKQNIAARLTQQLSDSNNTTAVSANQYSNLIQEEGMLFIGIEKLNPLQTISLLFQFAEGSAEDEDNDPPSINWSYLTYNEWRPLKGENLVSDGTYGFQTTGIVKIDVPEDANDHNTIITDGLHWFCASVTNNSNRIPQLVDVVTQAVVAQFTDQNNDQSHFDKALPAGSVSKMAVTVAAVSKVSQPFASFDGKHKEVGKEYYTRVSERLRHKARAVTAWDYEHLVLDQFPSVYKVKCITHTDPNCICRHAEKIVISNNGIAADEECCGPQIAPGHVLIVPIADLKNRNATNPLQPKTSRRTLLEIQDYLKKVTSPFVHVHAKNPVYEQIIVRFKVQFYTGTDKGYYMKKLNDEIVHYLTPWAFDETADVSFNQKIYASSIINFIEDRSYVDFITDFVMGVCRNECCPAENTPAEDSNNNNDDTATNLEKITGCSDMEHLLQDDSDFRGDVVAVPSTGRSILVSVPQHIIIPYQQPVQLSRCEQRKSEIEVTLLPGTGLNNAGGETSSPATDKPAEQPNEQPK